MILVPGIFLFTGLYFLVGYVLVPMISIHASASTYYPIIDPISVSPILSVLKNDSSKFTFNELDYEFREKRDENFIIRDDAPDRFYITIPKLDIYDAIVETNSDTLDPIDMLGHYKGTCLPDEDCNIFIYGHSTHKWVKNKYESGDYSSVFSNLDELEYGDEIIINFNNKEYKYIVDSSIIKKPEEVDPLAQPYPKTLADHKSSIELFTCTPAGSTKYRLTVVAKQVN